MAFFFQKSRCKNNSWRNFSLEREKATSCWKSQLPIWHEIFEKSIKTKTELDIQLFPWREKRCRAECSYGQLGAKCAFQWSSTKHEINMMITRKVKTQGDKWWKVISSQRYPFQNILSWRQWNGLETGRGYKW